MCLDDGNSYICLCPDGFSDQDCGQRPNICGPNNLCGDTGECVDDYTTNNIFCLCNEGFDAGKVTSIELNLITLCVLDPTDFLIILSAQCLLITRFCLFVTHFRSVNT